ncbi:50S ribosomal protein L6 [Helicobacter monodelphidis]|uniref:50S ribosomal protein L6 n=1 Tax=Helicobacter sp. 15-1451 TaxID=2004995 RepID=UPI000DCC5329|nr:50S ribosomal protein L6 [Helicobacter sp. 15-1451]RAX57118.1 50S ribosomal protein L6 [Helicobacter sp. 15-1451]
MSRIGKKPITIPSGLEVKVEGTKIYFTKGKDKKELETFGRVHIALQGSEVCFSTVSDNAQDRAFWGTYRALANNIIEGLDKGFSKQLEINGVGYRAAMKGKVLELNLGFSHPINFEVPEGIEISVDKNLINIKGSDKQQVGQVAANIREFRPPEPYKGKGVKYTDEIIIRKAGKTSKK